MCCRGFVSCVWDLRRVVGFNNGGSYDSGVVVVVVHAYCGLFPPCWRCYDLLKVCHRFVVGVPMFWHSDYCPNLLRSAGVKFKVCLLRTVAALISVSIFVIDFGLIWSPHHSFYLMLDSWSRKRHVELVAIFCRELMDLELSLCWQTIHTPTSDSPFTFVWLGLRGSKGSFSLLPLFQGVDGTWVALALVEGSITASNTID